MAITTVLARIGTVAGSAAYTRENKNSLGPRFLHGGLRSERKKGLGLGRRHLQRFSNMLNQLFWGQRIVSELNACLYA
jgi:hypothetical protein